ncbi:MAG: enoyl-CoA hydratase/isomerase family protein [Alphaproteobacteria bacterium]|nr:enoyl-CoA hydratase/isomerase family protein [Alphaproteobacteria bacterium]
MSRFIDLQRQARGRVEGILDRPDKLNALSLALLGNLTEVLNSLARDGELRCVVLSGAGRAFSAGADLVDLRRLDRSSAERFIRCLHAACLAVRDCPVPVIARIDGPCLGGALELAASCDMRAASGRSIFAMPEVRLGIPSVIEAALLPRLMGWGRAAELLFTGRTLTASEALAAGLVEAVAEDPVDIVETWAGDILDAGPRAIRAQKNLMRAWERTHVDDAIEAGVEAFCSSWESDEAPRRIARAGAGRAATGRSA